MEFKSKGGLNCWGACNIGQKLLILNAVDNRFDQNPSNAGTRGYGYVLRQFVILGCKIYVELTD